MKEVFKFKLELEILNQNNKSMIFTLSWVLSLLFPYTFY